MGARRNFRRCKGICQFVGLFTLPTDYLHYISLKKFPDLGLTLFESFTGVTNYDDYCEIEFFAWSARYQLCEYLLI